MQKLKTKFTVLICGLALLCALPGCKTQLETGGAYAPTNSVGQVVQAPDVAFFQVDSAFDLAMSLANSVFNIERDNRAFLESINPNIKHSLDAIRPNAKLAAAEYATARKAYKATPTPAGLTALETALAKIKQVNAAAQAVLPDINKAIGK